MDFFLGCGHCKRSKPEFVKAAAHFKDDIKHEFAAVDCTSDNCKQTCSDNNVDGFPTFVLFKYGQFVQKYHKERTVSDFFFSNLQKSEKDILKIGNFERLLKNNLLFFFGKKFLKFFSIMNKGNYQNY